MVHDASGCNSTYSTHDEPRWNKKPSNIFISALTERDAIMGNDAGFIENVSSAAKDLKPKFICICGSPMPALIGTDFTALAEEIEINTSIPCFSVATTGTYSYIQGAGEALLQYIKKFCIFKKKNHNTVNILGFTPLDFYINGQLERIVKLFADNGINVNFIGKYCEDILCASVNLVISQSGLKAAKYMWENYNIPYMCGIPIGEKLSELILKIQNIQSPTFIERNTEKSDLYIIGESIFSQSLSYAIELETGLKSGIIYPLENEGLKTAPADFTTESEEETENFLSLNAKKIIADPIYKNIAPKNAVFHDLPHFAFSGRCYEHIIPNLICNSNALKELIK